MKMETGFGWVQVGTTRYEHDIIVHADGKVSKRKKKSSKGLKEEYGHTPLSEFELDLLEGERPELVFIGTGSYGALPLTPGALRILKKYEVHILPTPEVLSLMEAERRSYVAILHVTC